MQEEMERVSQGRDDRRSSVRVKSRLPCRIERAGREAIPRLEAQILDMAVLESDGVIHDAVDWRDHTEDLTAEMVFVLNEVRALRQQLTEVQRVLERHGQRALEYRWMELNDQGLWLEADGEEQEWAPGEVAWVRIQIPSLQSPEVRAVAEVIRLDEEAGRVGVAFEFRVISQAHQRAISRYALRRERQAARSLRFDFKL